MLSTFAWLGVLHPRQQTSLLSSQRIKVAELIAKPASQLLQYPSGTRGALVSLGSLLPHFAPSSVSASCKREEGAQVVCGCAHAGQQSDLTSRQPWGSESLVSRAGLSCWGQNHLGACCKCRFLTLPWGILPQEGPPPPSGGSGSCS